MASSSPPRYGNHEKDEAAAAIAAAAHRHGVSTSGISLAALARPAEALTALTVQRVCGAYTSWQVHEGLIECPSISRRGVHLIQYPVCRRDLMKKTNLTCTNHGIDCIVAPHMVEAIKLKGSSEQRRTAEAMETQATQSREEREVATHLGTSVAAPVLTIIDRLKPSRSLYDGQGGHSLPALLVRHEGQQPISDVAVNEAYDGAGAVYDLYANAVSSRLSRW